MRWLPGCFRGRHRWGLAAEANAVAEPEQRSAVSNGTSLRLSSTEGVEDGTRPKSSAMIAHPCRVAPRRQLWRQSREVANIIAAVSRYERRLIGNRHQDEEPGAGEQQRGVESECSLSDLAQRSPLSMQPQDVSRLLHCPRYPACSRCTWHARHIQRVSHAACDTDSLRRGSSRWRRGSLISTASSSARRPAIQSPAAVIESKPWTIALSGAAVAPYPRSAWEP